MNRVLIDTSAYAAFMRGVPQAVDAIRVADEIYVTAIVLGELLGGFVSGTKSGKNRSELALFLESPRVALIDIDEETAERYAIIFAALRSTGTPVPTNDLWIAASAMQHGLRVLTCDAHFLRIPQVLTEFIPRPR